MQLLRHSRRLAAPILLALGGLAASATALAARTQEATFVPVMRLSAPPEEYEDSPRRVRGDLLLASDGNIYFGSTAGGNGAGAIARLTPEGVVSTLYAFKGDGTEGLSVYGKLTQASDGHLYGTTYLGGEEGGGTLFRVTLDGTFTVLHNFGGGRPNAIFPYTGVTQGPDGFLYGITLNGGELNKGTIYKIGTDGTAYSVLHEFRGDDGENPEGVPVVGADGLLYGTTMMGGENNRGTIYRITTAGDHDRLYSFPRLGRFNDQGLPTNSTGANPRAGLLLGLDGNFYGTAYQGGPQGGGTVYRMTPDGDVSLVHGFAGPLFGGAAPLAGVTQDADGNLYGTTAQGGYRHLGAAYRIAPDGTFSLLHAFQGTIDGIAPFAGLLPAHGAIYGATMQDTAGGGSGSIFKLDLGTGGVLPVEVQIDATDIMVGTSITVSWTAPAGLTCTKTGGVTGWTGETTNTGSQQFTPTPGSFTFGLTCADPDDDDEETPTIVRGAAYAGLVVHAPPLQPVDGGGGAGSLSLSWLLLAAALLYSRVQRERLRQCP